MMTKPRAAGKPLATSSPCAQLWPNSLLLLSALEKITTSRKIVYVVLEARDKHQCDGAMTYLGF